MKNLVNMDMEALEELMEEEAMRKRTAKREAKNKVPARLDGKRMRTSYISASKKAVKKASSAVNGDVMAEEAAVLNKEICGRKKCR